MPTTGAILGKDAPKNEHPTVDTDSLFDKSRLDYLNAIAEGNEEREKEDYADFDGENIIEQADDGITEPKDDKQDKDPADKEGVSTDQEGDQPQEPAADDEEYEELIVDGEKQNVPKSKILDTGRRSMQKELAADKRLKEASELLKQMQYEQQAWLERRGAEQQQQQQPPSSQEEAAKLKLDIAYDKLGKARNDYVQSTIDGSTQQQADALMRFEQSLLAYNNLNNARQQPNINDDQLQQYINEQFYLRDQEALRMHNESIVMQLEQPPEQGGFEDLLKNPRAKKLFIAEVDDMLANDEPNIYETYAKAGQAIREFLGFQGAASNAVPSNPATAGSIAQKKALKLKTEDQIKTTGAVVTNQNKQAKPFSEADELKAGIEQLRKQRGQLFMPG